MAQQPAGKMFHPNADRSAPLLHALKASSSALAGVGILTGVVNIFALAGSLFMLEVYDRVIPSHSIPTLIGLVLMVGFVYCLQGVLDALRARLLTRIGIRLDEELNPRVYSSVLATALRTRDANGLIALRDLDQVRAFCSSLGLTALFDLPWVPLYLTICFLFHPLVGVVALAGALLLVGLTLTTEAMTRYPSKKLAEAGERRMLVAESARRNAEAIQCLGMAPAIGAQWEEANSIYLDRQRRLTDTAAGLSTLSRTFRMMLQSGMLAVGAYLVIEKEASGGIMIASSILMSRGLAPIELAIGNWGNFVNARRSWKRLKDLFSNVPEETLKLPLPAPSQSLVLDNASAAAPGTDRVIVRNVSFELKAGEALGIIGPSGCGKSSLVRLLVGAWRPIGGKIRLDGAALDQWNSAALGSYIGYLPQEVELLSGSIAQNIARFDADAKTDDIIEAAKAAGIHEMIVGLPQGYDMDVGDRGNRLSVGQRQRIALARALYGNPFLVVLDEPNSNLDSEGEQALSTAILACRARGAIVIVVAHRPIALTHVGRILFMKNGTVEFIGPRDEIMGQLMQQASPARAMNSKSGSSAATSVPQPGVREPRQGAAS